ncbi:UvrD-helicase domain-containing protein [Viridibacillus arvi]|uniref:UvrD-helicase domain-containing protein n=1 Tax=Viridibacillus arvi TaxID=263475 RepID=UPI003D274A47
MKLIVAGAGAGKTTSMAEEVLKRYEEIKDGKVIYVITYTNAARDHIRKKIVELHGSIPKQIKVETSHVFLLQEIIFPFNYLLYGQLYTKSSIIALPSNRMYRANKLKELRAQNIIHVEEVTEFAKYILVGKSSDKKLIKERRKQIIVTIGRYLNSLFIDEVQDIDNNLSKIIEVLYNNNFNLHLVGDPKQDLRGKNELRKLIEKYSEYVEYKSENYRCPISHVNFSNRYVIEEEKQAYQTTELGSIEYLFETDIDISEFIKTKNFEHMYIYQKNDRFITNGKDKNEFDNLLKYELKRLIQKSKYAENQVEKRIYILNNWIQEVIYSKNNWGIINRIGELLSLKLTKEDKGRMITALDLSRERKEIEGMVVDSIDKVKGLEGETCLFILSTELAEYLFQIKKDQNKMANYLYVALTRAKKELYILITKEIETKYSREWVNAKLVNLFKDK